MIESSNIANLEGAGASRRDVKISEAQGISPEWNRMFCGQHTLDVSLIQLLVGSALCVTQFQSPPELQGADRGPSETRSHKILICSLF